MWTSSTSQRCRNIVDMSRQVMEQDVMRTGSHDLRCAAMCGMLSLQSGANSNIPGHLRLVATPIDMYGYGVSADRRFAPGEPIIVGFGEIRLTANNPHRSMSYAMDRAGQEYSDIDLCFQDIYPGQSNIVRYINSSYNVPNTGPNVELLWLGPLLIVYARSSISMGRELLANYVV